MYLIIIRLMPYLTFWACVSNAEVLYFCKFDMEQRFDIYSWMVSLISYFIISFSAILCNQKMFVQPFVNKNNNTKTLIIHHYEILPKCFYKYVHVYIRYIQKWQWVIKLLLVWKWWKINYVIRRGIL